jgi:tripartite-type tricarboxylate transporter receptor subunit TctC
MKRIARLLSTAAVIALSTAAAPAAAQMRIMTGFPPGGALDSLARIFAERLAEALGRPVVVETRAGATGQIAAQAVKASPPDGNTLMVVPDSMITLYPHIVSKPVYDTLADFAPVAHLGGYPIALAVNVNVPARDLKEYIGWARQSPTNPSYGTAGIGTTLHFLGLIIGQATGLPMLHVPYKGAGPAISDTVAGQIPAVIMPLGPLLPQAGPSGRLRILAHSGARRAEAAPAIPTFRELGFPTVEATGWFALFAPARTPAAVVSRYNDIVVQAIRTPAIREKLRGLDMEPREMTPAEMAAQLKLEYDRWGPIVKASGFSADQ